MAGKALLRATMQTINRIGHGVTVSDPDHPISWARRGKSRNLGEITFEVRHEDGVPVIKVRIVEVQKRPDDREEREMTFEIFGSSALEVHETLRDGIEATPLSGPKGFI